MPKSKFVEFICTPLVRLKKTEPVLLMPLKSGIHLKVERMTDNSEHYYTDAADTLFDGMVLAKTPAALA